MSRTKKPTITPNESTEVSRAFWASVREGAAASRARPEWARGGIELNPVNFVTAADYVGLGWESP
jgi:hypothetical protein